jgi:chromosome segregation ATPase
VCEISRSIHEAARFCKHAKSRPVGAGRRIEGLLAQVAETRVDLNRTHAINDDLKRLNADLRAQVSNLEANLDHLSDVREVCNHRDADCSDMQRGITGSSMG